ncbi:MAG: Rossmann-like and DUF2520 domain-containing protein [Burkholderiaceae bacterium]
MDRHDADAYHHQAGGILRPTLTIIGCGNLGRSLGYLWQAKGIVTLAQALNSSLKSAQRAVSFMGAGTPVAGYPELAPADLYLIAVPDDRIAACARQLAATGLLTNQSIVFHCSGSLSSDVMQEAAASGAQIASVHPIRSFASPEQVIASFDGTWCGMEGSADALSVLEKLFQAIGAKTVAINPSTKMLYHSAAVFASNYLVTLADVAVEAYQQAGIPREIGLQMIAPLMRRTIDNVVSQGPERALSGPVARDDWQTVDKQYRAIQAWDPDCASLYKQLAQRTAILAGRRGKIQD